MKRFLSLSLIALTAVIITATVAPAAQAVTGGDFKAGRIIDDYVFNNKNAMSPEQIQQFLNSKVNCDTWGAQPYAGTTRAQYGAARGNPAPYTCLPQYHENPTTHENNLEGRGIPSGGMSAANIIYTAAQAYDINPQVLIVLLQKEQGLVTDEWPWPIQYRSATGYGCPDTAACDTRYYGFYNQVHNAAYQFRLYANNPNSYNHVAGQNNYVRWSPTASCGGSTVYIENQATASLYNYTPYQPNSAALNNLYGTGDACSAYGNRNFWRYFNDWFGSTLGPDYQAKYHSQSEYITIKTGETKTAWFKMQNVGRQPWGDDISAAGWNPIHLATSYPTNRSSVFGATWPLNSRPNLQFSAVYESNGTTLAADQHVVKPGQIALFQFTITAPPNVQPGWYQENFMPIREGADIWWMDGHVWMGILVESVHKAEFYSQSPYPTLKANDQAWGSLAYKNVGNLPWYDDTSLSTAPAGTKPVHLATAWPINRTSYFGYSWPTPTRPAVTFAAVFEADGTTPASNQHVAQPGQIAKFDISFTGPIPAPAGFYKESFRPIVEGAEVWDMQGNNAWLGLTFQSSNRKAQYHSQNAWLTLSRGSSGTVYFQFKNTGDVAWRDDTANVPGLLAVHLATTNPINRTSQFKGTDWSYTNRPKVTFARVYEADGTTLTANQHIVQPGQIGRFEFSVNVPSNATPGQYTEYFQPILEGAPWTLWSMDGLVFMHLTVQ